MNISLHKMARTTPAIRREIQRSDVPTKTLARQMGLNAATVRKWRGRDEVNDLSHRPHRLHCNLSPAQEVIVVELRRLLLLPLDDLLAITHEFINDTVSRSGLDRCLRKHGVSSLKVLKQELAGEPAKPVAKNFKPYEPGFVHVDVKYLPQMPDETRRSYLYVAIDRASRWVYLEVLNDKKAATAAGFFKRLIVEAHSRSRSSSPTTARSSPIAFARPANAHLPATTGSTKCVLRTALITA